MAGRAVVAAAVAGTTNPLRWWTPISAGVAPVALIGSWTIAAARRAGFDSTNFDSMRDTISALAAVGAPDRWIVTTGLGITGICHLLTAAGLSAGRPRGRAVLAAAGLATLGVAAFPLPGEHGASGAHTVAATTAFLALSVWPALSVWRTPAARRAAGVLSPLDPFGPRVGYSASAGLLAVLAAFAAAIATDRYVGLAERVAAGSQAIWPLLAVILLRRIRR